MATYLLKEIGSVILDLVNTSLIREYKLRAYRIAVIKPQLKKMSLDADDVASHFQTSPQGFCKSAQWLSLEKQDKLWTIRV